MSMPLGSYYLLRNQADIDDDVEDDEPPRWLVCIFDDDGIQTLDLAETKEKATQWMIDTNGLNNQCWIFIKKGNDTYWIDGDTKDGTVYMAAFKNVMSGSNWQLDPVESEIRIKCLGTGSDGTRYLHGDPKGENAGERVNLSSKKGIAREVSGRRFSSSIFRK